MLAAPARYVSVSELYAADEVELLLDEIRELEPTSCRGEDAQVPARIASSRTRDLSHADFEIAGSGVGGGGGGGRSPAGTELTERSWDSHAQYSRAPPPRPRRLAPLYCRLRALRKPRAALALLLVCACAAACGCVWWVCGVGGGGAARLPLAARWRLLLLGALSSALLHAALLALELTRLAALLPLDWPLVRLAGSAWSAVSLGAGGALALHAVLGAREFRYAPPHLAAPLLSAAGLGLAGCGVALVLTGCGARRWLAARRGLRSAPGQPPTPAARATYRAVPSGPGPGPAQPQPSTSRDAPL